MIRYLLVNVKAPNFYTLTNELPSGREPRGVILNERELIFQEVQITAAVS